MNAGLKGDRDNHEGYKHGINKPSEQHHGLHLSENHPAWPAVAKFTDDCTSRGDDQAIRNINKGNNIDDDDDDDDDDDVDVWRHDRWDHLDSSASEPKVKYVQEVITDNRWKPSTRDGKGPRPFLSSENLTGREVAREERRKLTAATQKFSFVDERVNNFSLKTKQKTTNQQNNYKAIKA